MLKEKFPDCVVVPEIVPDELASDSPAGNLPEIKLQV
jgi:hypothetical protein